MTQSEILNSWKEISNYIGRGVRTVQRWEKDFGLPVRRPCGHLRGSVFAVRDDVDQWLNTRGSREMARTASEAVTLNGGVKNAPGLSQVHYQRLRENARLLIERCNMLKAGTEALEANIQRTEALRARMRNGQAAQQQQNAVA
jgi:hypothetical protein